eukprot:GEMP01072061.1.p1 GENE.GEMP01072061.1~~GEMP01072061.1.p1  ORF type:complete len:156 (-),score=3.04 GEMP01072061.1:343-810(-)
MRRILSDIKEINGHNNCVWYSNYSTAISIDIYWGYSQLNNKNTITVEDKAKLQFTEVNKNSNSTDLNTVGEKSVNPDLKKHFRGDNKNVRESKILYYTTKCDTKWFLSRETSNTKSAKRNSRTLPGNLRGTKHPPPLRPMSRYAPPHLVRRLLDS